LIAVAPMQPRSILRSVTALAAIVGVAFGLRAIATRAHTFDDLDDGLCGASEIARWPSPDGARVVRAKIVDCGATTDFALWISIGPANDWLALATSSKGAIVFDHASPTPRASLDVTWTGPREVALTVTTADRRLGPEGAFREGDVHVRWKRATPR
jgi:hypothetical protein